MKIRKKTRMPKEEIFTRGLFGFILIIAAFIPGGRWVALALGIFFILSAVYGICFSCIIKQHFLSRE